MTLARRLVAEALGTAFLLAIVVGSGIMGERLAAGNTALALLANALATGAGLIALILTFAPISGAHFNPAVTLVMLLRGAVGTRDAALFIPLQIAGCILGAVVGKVMSMMGYGNGPAPADH